MEALSAATIFKGATTAFGVMGALDEGDQAEEVGLYKQAMAEYEAKQLESAGTAAYAEGTRDQQELLRQGKVIQSDATARMAASGGGVDPEELAKLKTRTDYNALAALFEKKSEQQLYERQAGAKRIGGAVDVWQGEMQKKASRRKALSTAFSGAFDMFGGMSFGGNPTSSFKPMSGPLGFSPQMSGATRFRGYS